MSMLNASNFSTSNRLLGGGSACGKDSAHIVQQKAIKSEPLQHSKDTELINTHQNSTNTQ